MHRPISGVLVTASLLFATACTATPLPNQPSVALSQGIRLQPVNNDFALKHVDDRLATMTDDIRKVYYLALHGCAAEIAQLGVYGPVADNPLMERWNELNERYNKLYEGSNFGGRKAQVPTSLTAAEDRLCKGDHPL